MLVKAIRDFISPVYGNVDGGQVLDLDENVASNWIGAGLVEAFVKTPKIEIETKPQTEVLETKPAPVLEVLKKRGRKPKEV